MNSLVTHGFAALRMFIKSSTESGTGGRVRGGGTAAAANAAAACGAAAKALLSISSSGVSSKFTSALKLRATSLRFSFSSSHSL